MTWLVCCVISPACAPAAAAQCCDVASACALRSTCVALRALTADDGCAVALKRVHARHPHI